MSSFLKHVEKSEIFNGLMFVSEPIFVPRPHCKSEDDGILCVTLLGNSFLIFCSKKKNNKRYQF